MEQNKIYSLPDLAFGYKDLEPHMSEEQLKIHHTKHHNAYVIGANTILEKLDQADSEIDVKSVAKAFAFQIGGYVLHTLFWQNLSPSNKTTRIPAGKTSEAIDDNFKNFSNFKKLFSDLAFGVEGSGWAALTVCPETKRLMLMQVEKHNINIYPTFPVLLVLDMFEHAYYIDYQNEKGKYIEAFWQIVNWEEVNKRYERLIN